MPNAVRKASTKDLFTFIASTVTACQNNFQPRIFMHRFPNELKQAVLVETAEIGGLDALLALASSSHIYHDLYRANEKVLLAHALSAIPQPVLTILSTLAITPMSNANKHE